MYVAHTFKENDSDSNSTMCASLETGMVVIDVVVVMYMGEGAS